MELPAYHRPTLMNVLRGTWERGWSYIKSGNDNNACFNIRMVYIKLRIYVGRFRRSGKYGRFHTGQIGSAFAVLFRPLGFGTWQSSVATVLGLVAKEEVVGTFGTLYAVAGDALGMVEEGAFADLRP